MANHLSAKKRSRQNEKRALRNAHIRTTMRTYIKRVRVFVDDGKKDEAREGLAPATQWLDKAVTKGIMHRRTASRTISRLTKAVNKLFS